MGRQCGIVKAAPCRLLAQIRATRRAAARIYSSPSTMAPTKASERYAVKVVSLPKVVMAHLPISSALIQTSTLTGKGVVRSRQYGSECPQTPSAWLKLPEINALKSL
jgi:hypothetical protein